MKKILYVILLVLLLGSTGAAWYVYENAEGLIHPSLIPPDYYWLDDKANLYEETGIVAIAGREFKIPVAYVDGRFKNGRMEGGVVLEYVLPDFKSKLEFSYKEKRQQLINEGLMRGMLLEAAADRPSLATMIDNHRNIGQDRIGVFQEKIYGLEKYSVNDWKGRMRVQPDDTFIERNKDGNIVSFIKCSPPGKDKIPGCSHKFIDHGLLYNIHWKISELPHWREQQKAAIQFIDSFEVNKSK